MEINISAKQMELTDALKSYIEEKMDKINKFYDRSITVDIHLNVEKHLYHIHATLKGDGHLHNSEADDPQNMYKAIDLCVTKLESQVKKSKRDRHGQKLAKEEERKNQLA
ncbi:MAG: putative sigma-54 modulation protein [bacterium]|jgi:putative sigma-54 modulation protein